MTVITGKTGVGKTTIIKAIGFQASFSADEFVKYDLYRNNSPVYEMLIKKFPSLTQGELIDTKELGKLVLNDPKKLKELDDIVHPFVVKWLSLLPEESLVEMAAYINNEEKYKQYFNKVVLIERDNPDTSKLDYAKEGLQPIQDKQIKYDHLIKNNGHIADAVIELKDILFKK